MQAQTIIATARQLAYHIEQTNGVSCVARDTGGAVEVRQVSGATLLAEVSFTGEIMSSRAWDGRYLPIYPA